MSPVGMYNSAGEEPIPLISFGNGGRIKNKVIDQFMVGESANGYRGGEKNDGEGDGEGHA